MVDFNHETDKPWILSQTDIIRHISNHPDSVTDLLNLETRVHELNLIQKQQLVIVKEDEIAIQVYRHMAEKNLNGVPVIKRYIHI